MEKDISTNSRKINISLNVIKCVAVFGVICIHCNLDSEGTFGLMVDGISRFAVPFFFLISGFYSYFGDDVNKALYKYKTRIIKLIKLLIVSNLVYFIYFVGFTHHYKSFADIISIVDINNIIGYILFNRSPTGVHLWFIESLIYCYIIYYILSKLNIDCNRLYKWIPVLLVSCIVLEELLPIFGIKVPIAFYRNFLFIGLPFFALGYLIHDKEDLLINKYSDTFLIELMIFGCLLSILEVLLFGKLNLFIGTIILSIGIFLWGVKNPEKLKLGLFAFIGGNLYTSMYVLHVIVKRSIKFPLGYFKPFVVFIITAIISYIIYLIIKKLKEY